MAAGIKSSFLRSAIIKHNLRIASFTQPAGCYLALYTSDPTINDTGTEVTGGSYARQNMNGKWGSESNGAVASNAAVTFTSLPTVTITYWGIRSAVTGGNLLYFGKFDIAVEKNAGENLTIASGNIILAER